MRLHDVVHAAVCALAKPSDGYMCTLLCAAGVETVAALAGAAVDAAAPRTHPARTTARSRRASLEFVSGAIVDSCERAVARPNGDDM
jgi:hypothetical protein